MNKENEKLDYFILSNPKFVPDINIGNGFVNSNKLFTVKVKNDVNMVDCRIKIDSINVFDPENGNCFYAVNEYDSKNRIQLGFKPNKIGIVRGRIHLTVNDKVSLIGNLYGNGMESPEIVQHENAKRSKVYDGKAMEKQENGFKRWMNYVLLPKLYRQNKYQGLVHARENANIRRMAHKMYHTEVMDDVLYTISKEVDLGKLEMREDRQVHLDLGMQRDFIDLVVKTYEMDYLRLGLEIVLGLNTKNDAVNRKNTTRKLLRKFVEEHVVKDQQIDAQFSKKTKVLQGKHMEVYSKALQKKLVKKFLMLVYFLDQARLMDMIPQMPRLFQIKSKYKHSRAVIVQFCTEYLHGEGNILRHLASIGYNVTYKQSVLDEYDMHTNNLATDLRDGVRLVRLVEYLLQQKHTNVALDADTFTPPAHYFSKHLRMPAVSRLQKIHNVDVALSALSKNNITLERAIQAKDIVDGNQAKTLDLVWELIVIFQLEKLVDKDKLRDEIQLIVSTMQHDAFQMYQDQQCSTIDAAKSNHSKQLMRMIKEWCIAIAACYGIKVHNFTTCFADGRVLCYLVQYYHPALLCIEQIYDPDNQDSACVLSSEQYESALDGERGNFLLLNEKVEELGCIPPFEMDFNSESIPEEKVIITFVAHLLSRLLESSTEIRSAFIIQDWWRTVWPAKWKARSNRAAKIIQVNWYQHDATKMALRRCRRILAFAAIRERFLLSVILKRRFANVRDTILYSVLIIQRTYRKHFYASDRFRQLREFNIQLAAIKLQAFFRSLVARKLVSLLRFRKCIQNNPVIRKPSTRVARMHRSNLAIAKLQAAIRGYIVRKVNARLALNAKNHHLTMFRLHKVLVKHNLRVAMKHWQDIDAAMFQAAHHNMLVQKQKILFERKEAQNLLERNSKRVLYRFFIRQIAVRQVRHWAANRICSFYRRALYRRKVAYIIRGINVFRACHQLSRIRQTYFKRVHATVRIQRWWKTCMLQIRLYKAHCSIALIQRATRKWLFRRRIQHHLQNSFKRRQALAKLNHHLKAIVIQAAYKKYCERKRKAIDFDTNLSPRIQGNLDSHISTSQEKTDDIDSVHGIESPFNASNSRIHCTSSSAFETPLRTQAPTLSEIATPQGIFDDDEYNTPQPNRHFRMGTSLSPSDDYPGTPSDMFAMDEYNTPQRTPFLERVAHSEKSPALEDAGRILEFTPDIVKSQHVERKMHYSTGKFGSLTKDNPNQCSPECANAVSVKPTIEHFNGKHLSEPNVQKPPNGVDSDLYEPFNEKSPERSISSSPELSIHDSPQPFHAQASNQTIHGSLEPMLSPQYSNTALINEPKKSIPNSPTRSYMDSPQASNQTIHGSLEPMLTPQYSNTALINEPEKSISNAPTLSNMDSPQPLHTQASNQTIHGSIVSMRAPHDSNTTFIDKPTVPLLNTIEKCMENSIVSSAPQKLPLDPISHSKTFAAVILQAWFRGIHLRSHSPPSITQYCNTISSILYALRHRLQTATQMAMHDLANATNAKVLHECCEVLSYCTSVSESTHSLVNLNLIRNILGSTDRQQSGHQVALPLLKTLYHIRQTRKFQSDLFIRILDTLQMYRDNEDIVHYGFQLLPSSAHDRYKLLQAFCNTW